LIVFIWLGEVCVKTSDVLKCGIRRVTLRKKPEVGGEDGGICTAVVLRKKAAQAAAFKRVEGQLVERDLAEMKEGYGYEDGGGLIETSEVPVLHDVSFSAPCNQAPSQVCTCTC
jgi:hypothetical protein